MTAPRRLASRWCCVRCVVLSRACLAASVQVHGSGTEDAAAESGGRRSIDSTSGQDSGRCPLVKLPGRLSMLADESSWASQSGTWRGDGDVTYSSFRQWFLSMSWDTAYVRDLDERNAFRMEVTGNEELWRRHGWKRLQNPMDFPAIAKLERDWWERIHQGAYTLLRSPKERYAARGVDDRRLWRTTSVLDCEGRLLLVVKLLQQSIVDVPAGIDVYDPLGGLEAHAMVDFKTSRFQFVDTRGNLLATAEAPAVGAGVDLASVRRDPDKGNILPYELKFEQGGYHNSSRLLQPDYRWVLAAAVQARALDDAQRGWAPWAPSLLLALYVAAGALALAIAVCTCGALCRRPPSRGDADARPPAWERKAQPPFYYADPADKAV